MGGEMGPNQDAVAAMEIILRQLQSPDNAARNEAEATFNAARAQAGACMSALATLATKSEDEAVKAMAAVLLRRSATELWGNADAPSKEFVKQQLFDGIRMEVRQEPRRKLCDTVSAVAGTGTTMKTGMDINEILPFLFELYKSPHAHQREAALYIFSQLTDFFSDELQPHLGSLFETFKQGLQDPDLNVEVEALRATSSVLNTFEARACQNFGELIPLMMRPISSTLNNQDENNARLCLEQLIETVENEPRCWRKFLPQVSDLMLQIATTKSLEDGTRQLGMEFLVTAAEQLPSVSRKMGNFVERVFPVALQFMLEVEEDQDWYDRDDDDDDDDYSNYDLGQEALDRLAIKLTGKTILPVAFAIIPEFLSNQESWKHRHAALLAISQIGEGCQQQILDNLGSVAAMALNHFKDSHARVRWAAVHCIGQMCTDFAPAMQENFHQQIVPSLIEVMDDSSQPRVQSHAAAAIINFCEEASAEIIQLYMEQLLSRLMNLLRSPRKLIQEQAVTAVASVADSAGVTFQPYYDSFMPDLKQVLALAGGEKKLSRLRGKVMECVSIIGLAVGKEMFKKDSGEVMDVLVKTQATQMEPDDPQSYYLMQAYARICRCLKDDFIPYLPFVMPRLLEAASIKPEIEVLSVLDDDEDEDNGVDTYVYRDKRIGIRTSALDDKSTACSMITCFVSELKGGFLQYVQPVVQLMVPLLRFLYHDGCRTAAAQSLPDLLNCVSAQGDAYAQQYQELLNYILPELILSITRELDVEVMVTKVESLGEIISQQRIGDQRMIKSSSDCLREVLRSRISRIDERKKALEEDGYDVDEQIDILQAETADDELLDRVADVINSICKNIGESFLPFFEEEDGQNTGNMLSMFGGMLHPEGRANDRRVALCVFDDIIEFCGNGGLKYIENVLPAMLAYANDPDPDVKQAAAYGIGVAAEKGGEVFKRSGGSTVAGPLEATLRSPDARSSENERATDNTISAIARIIEFQSECLEDKQKFALALLQYLPMKVDVAEAINVHERLVRLVESGNMIVLGANFSNLGHILRIFSEVMSAKLLSDEYVMRAVAVLKSMQQQLPPGTLESASQGLNEQHKAVIQAAFNS